jgi:hypothetical protein
MTPPGRPVSNNATEQGTTNGDPVDTKVYICIGLHMVHTDQCALTSLVHVIVCPSPTQGTVTTSSHNPKYDVYEEGVTELC